MNDVRWLDADQQDAWRRWLDLNAQLTSLLNRRLREVSGLSLADYDVLVALTDAENDAENAAEGAAEGAAAERGLRIGELGARLGWEKPRTTKQVSRMAARGLVHRRDSPDDGRAALVELTDTGLETIRAAAPAHVELVQQVFFDGLSGDEVQAVRDIADRVLRRVHGAQ